LQSVAEMATRNQVRGSSRHEICLRPAGAPTRSPIRVTK
jgi:hypothetical protein